MSQATRRRVCQHVDSLRDSTLLPFHDLLDVTAVAPTIAEARERTYEAAAKISFPGARYRTEFTCGTYEGVTPEMPESHFQVLQIARASDGTAHSQVRFDANNYSDADADLGLTIFQIVR